MKQIGFAMLFLLAGCASFKSTENIPAVTGFDTVRFMGDWHEIARLPNVYETCLTNVTFSYTKVDTRVDLVKKGYREDRERTLSLSGYPVGENDVAEFRLGLLYDFGVLHRVAWVSKDYDEAIVVGGEMSDLWILARKKQIPKTELDKLLKMAEDWGFDTKKLEYPHQPEKK